MNADVLVLGAELVKQLGKAAERNLLARWMANYLAEKMRASGAAKGATKQALDTECAELILKLWEHRHALPDGGRPLESFEVLFQVLNEIRTDQPRYSLLRNLPEIDDGTESGSLVQTALAVDQTASALIRYILAEAVAGIPPSDKRWARIRAATKESPWDMKLTIRLMDDADTLVDEAATLEEAKAADVRGIIEGLEEFESMSAALRQALARRLGVARSAKK